MSAKRQLPQTVWVRGGKKRVLDTYVELHRGRLVGAHWLWVAVERVAAGEPEEEVMQDYGYRKDQYAKRQ